MKDKVSIFEKFLDRGGKPTEIYVDPQTYHFLISGYNKFINNGIIEEWIKKSIQLEKNLKTDNMPYYDENNGQYDEWPDQTGEKE
jgi:hypothetical protein